MYVPSCTHITKADWAAVIFLRTIIFGILWYIYLWIGEEGQKIFNSFELTDDEKQKIYVIIDKFTPTSNLSHC